MSDVTAVLPTASPTFDPGGFNSRKTVNRVKVLMSEGMHDTAIITLRDEPTDAPELQPGTPIMMQYGWATVDMDWFYGYIDHIEHHYQRATPQGSTYEDVVCLGVSYTLKDPFVGAWSNVPCSAIVRLIAQKYFLATMLETDDPVWPQLSAPGSSAWTTLIQLANKVGYSLACNKSQLRFISVATAMKANWAGMPVFRTRNAAPTYYTQSISQFQALTGETAPIPGHTKAVRSITGINPQTGQVVAAANDGTGLRSSQLGQNLVYPFFGQQVSNQVVNSQGTAVATLQGMTECNRFNYQATATLAGLSSVKQGMPITLLGIDSNNDGVWWVQEVVHKIASTGYSMDVCLGRDSLGDSGARPVQGTAVAYTPNNPYVYTATNDPPTVLLNKRWRAAHSFNVNVSG